jgi:hypothetical protein
LARRGDGIYLRGTRTLLDALLVVLGAVITFWGSCRDGSARYCVRTKPSPLANSSTKTARVMSKPRDASKGSRARLAPVDKGGLREIRARQPQRFQCSERQRQGWHVHDDPDHAEPEGEQRDEGPRRQR